MGKCLPEWEPERKRKVYRIGNFLEKPSSRVGYALCKEGLGFTEPAFDEFEHVLPCFVVFVRDKRVNLACARQEIEVGRVYTQSIGNCSDFRGAEPILLGLPAPHRIFAHTKPPSKLFKRQPGVFAPLRDVEVDAGTAPDLGHHAGNHRRGIGFPSSSGPDDEGSCA